MLVKAVKMVMDFEMTIAEWIGTALMVLAPYGVIGLVWTVLNLDMVHGTGVIRLIRFVASIVFWPAMVFSAVCSV
ncbi:putative membrane protein [Mycolicibacterium hassiacum DSM 44199]|uniref:Putative membrane protein n=1 Tax=Mycolicibacterium hassiacum (strain DSM 44199 / CIP 105218 / JCM 12690 / 3849) TaxID=1122247 RepID=K5BBU0_MYCHD|nr:hypothetical protein [Mycolicibacterium hassiacum]EKF24575.1 putative membrane protein [Mycolicibacterium hassiacum DSM 44199]MBX5486690.1 hypothetical protein [Mycolicibacterium hassiacum]PZN20621.1 MAG: hypothetical protein DIU75_12040 [Mycolicibacterium hassiacum]VCT88865.1 hypothetical protein MHAS_00549 [Mycolicibacterium hassiacum DSM 44199]